MAETRISPFSPGEAPAVWTITLGWNHAEDTLECLQSLRASEGVRPRLLYVDNGSREEEVRRVLDGAPDVEVIRHEQNVGVSRGFNAGLVWALRKGADFVFMANNDTVMDRAAIRLLLEAAKREPGAGILVPKIYYYEAPDILWSAGSRFRCFPPAIVMNKTLGPDDGRYDRRRDLPFTTLCTVLIRAEALKRSGLMDPNFLFYFEDYEFSLRMRERGYRLRLVPEAHTRHKVARVTRASSASPAFWVTSGRSAAIFTRRHGRRHPWQAGPGLLGYLVLRAVVEGGWTAGRRFLAGLNEGRRMNLKPTPTWDDGSVDPVTVVRELWPDDASMRTMP